MNFLPLVGRELSAASKQGRTYWSRMVIAAVALLISLPMIIAMSLVGSGGQPAFVTLGGLCLVYSAFSGSYLTADCISSEKRDGTLGLLLLTDLRGYDIVLGKLAGTCLRLLYGLMALVPAFMLPLFAGGVRAGDVARGTLALLATTFLSASLGVLASSVSRQARRSVALTLAAGTFLWFILTPLLELWARKGGPPQLIAALRLFALSAMVSQAIGGAGSHTRFWESLTAVHGMSWAFIAAASFFLPRFWRDAPAKGMTRPWQIRLRLWGHGGKERRRRLLDQNPFFWLLARGRFSPVWPWLVTVAAIIILAITILSSGRSKPPFGAVIMILIWLHLLLKLWTAAAGATPIAALRRDGILELLLSTPLSVDEIVTGSSLHLRRYLGGPILLIVTSNLILVAYLIAVVNERWIAPWGIGSALILLADCFAVARLAMWRAISIRRLEYAAADAAVRVLLFPWLGILLMTALVVATRSSFMSDADTTFFLFWCGGSLLNDLLLYIYADSQLSQRFRELAASRESTVSEGWFARAFSPRS